MKKYFLILLVIICATSCILFDAGNAKTKRIVGNVYVIDSDEPNDPGFYVIFLQKSGYERHLMKSDEHIEYLKANDSVILIKTIPNPSIAYYIINHLKGDSILSIRNLSDSQFHYYAHSMNFKYSFIPTSKEEIMEIN